MLGQKNKTYMIVGKDIKPLINTEGRELLEAGQMGIFKNGSRTALGAAALAAGDTFKIAYLDVDGKILESPTYDYSLIKKKGATTYVAGAEQKSYIGYNGTTGSITVANSSIYSIHVIRKDWSKTWGEHGSFKLAAAYESDATATQTEIADALVLNMVKNFEVEKAKSGVTVTKVGRINAAATAAGYDFDGTATVVKGSNVISVTSTGTYNTGSAPLVGDYVRMGATTTGAVALTSQVYKITALSGSTTKLITLDRAVLEASGDYVTGSDYTQVIPSATAIAANWGLSIESEPVKFVPGLFKYQNVTFDITLSSAFGSTLVTKATTPSKGIGTYRDIAEMEWELRNNQREAYHTSDYPIQENLNAVSTKTYAVVTIEFANDNARTLNGYDQSFHSLIIATETDSSGNPHAELKTVFTV